MSPFFVRVVTGCAQSAQRRTVIAPLTGTGFRQLFFVLLLLVCPFGGHRHFMPLHYWLKRCNCLLKFTTC